MQKNTVDTGMDAGLSESKKRDIKRAMDAVLATKDRIHVITYGKKKWAVFPEGSKRMHKIYADQTTAVSDAKELAIKKKASSVILHNSDGLVDKIFSIG